MGTKLSQLSSIDISNLDDNDLLYIVDGDSSNPTLKSNKITVGALKAFIISGSGATKIIRYEVTEDSYGNPKLPDGTNFNSIVELIDSLVVVEMSYKGNIFDLASSTDNKLEFTTQTSTIMGTLTIGSNNVISYSEVDLSKITMSYDIIGN